MSKLLEDTHKLLEALPRSVSLIEIAKNTGLKITWLSALSRNQINDPGVKKVEKLHNYLKAEYPLKP